MSQHSSTHFGEFDPKDILAASYGIDAELTPLPGEYDRNFIVTPRSGDKTVLKVMRAGLSYETVDFQCSVLEHIAAKAPELQIPQVVPTARHALSDTIIDGDRIEHIVWMLTYIPGDTLAHATPRTPSMFESLGRLMGHIDAALSDFDHPAAHRKLKWDLSRPLWIKEFLDQIVDPARRGLVERFIDTFESEVAPELGSLRRGMIHNDANDHNVIVAPPAFGPREVVSVIDFGDMLHCPIVCEPAIAAAYALLGAPDPLAVAASVVRGYNQAHALDDGEVAVLWTMVAMRLCVSVVNSAYMKTQNPDDPYVTVTEDEAWKALERIAEVHPSRALYTLRAACGWEAVPHAPRVRRWIQKAAAPVLEVDLHSTACVVLDLSVGSEFLGGNPNTLKTPALSRRINALMQSREVNVAIGRYNEVRPIYTAGMFSGKRVIDECRNVHIGLDLFAEADTPVLAPLDGIVHRVADNAGFQNYGPTVILRHTTADGDEFFTLYGHLSKRTLTQLSEGDAIEAGECIGWLGTPPVNGDWPPHLHLQIILDMLDGDTDFPGVVTASERDVWTGVCPDPNIIVGVPAKRFPEHAASSNNLLRRRSEILGPNLSVSYASPLVAVRGWMPYLYDDLGRAYVDLFNNVPHVGHSHPQVVAAVRRQAELLNTNTRYLHEHILRYAERLVALMPSQLEVCYFLNSASEANELALRMARAHTGARDMIVLENAYHGHTSTLVDISPYKFNGPGGAGKPDWVHVAPVADDYRGQYKRDDSDAGTKYAGDVAALISTMYEDGRKLCAFIAESCPSVGGQIIFPDGYLPAVYDHVREAGGVCIADEVQTGFGRLGTHFWGFAQQDASPDIVVLGKPIGNGFPLAAVVTTREIAESFDTGMEFFSTFGGNPVSIAAGLAVLDVMEAEHLQANALRVGAVLRDDLRGIQRRHEIIGDVRGSGLFLGVELVRNPDTLEPATEAARYLVDRMRERGVLAGTDGPCENVVKLRGPLVLSEEDVRLAAEVMEDTLSEDAFQAKL